MSSSRAVPPPKIMMGTKLLGWAPRYPTTALFYGLGFPVTRTLALVGKWPKVLGGFHGDTQLAKAFEPGPQDVLVCSFFKSGTNWTMQTALQIAHRGEAQFGHIHELIPWIEMPEKRRMTVSASDDSVWHGSPTKLRIVKTHASFDDLLYRPEAKYIWVVRDPKDAFVSGYHFLRNVMLGRLMPSPEQWLELFLSADTPGGSWAQHAASGWANRHQANVLFLTYEEMKADLPGAARRMAALMGVDLTDREFARVVEQSSFAHMKAIGHKFDPPAWPWGKGEGAMIRRGERGSASEFLNDAQKRRIDDYWRAKLKRLGSDFPYDEMFATR